ncbi:magnesium transporter NIPA2 isoform X2 [Anoplophora glabripennis]|uniref:magnesium transporter NIPA2 isoform X2 n=1 Tax=Anoplophora glabripennis TaxID=217634 RepID=UPI000874E0B2|nr:magnesium transporter NIPA2 isoform X2 [Anoplophora glabripennis]
MENTSEVLKEKTYSNLDFYVGLTLAISSSVFIGSSFIIKKIALIRLTRKGSLRAGAGGFGYLNDWMWWFGFLTMGVGEVANFGAYAFAPASLVTPLGALSVLVSAVLASKCLNETLNILGKLGCVLCIVGSTVMVIHAPKEEQTGTLDDLLNKVREPTFLNYILVVISITVIILVYIGPRYGNKYVSVYITLCSAIGSLTVMACKALGLALKDFFSGTLPFSTHLWIIFGLLVIIAVCLCIQMTYLNRVLDLFNTNVVTPIYYVFFTTMVITASAILFKEWQKMSSRDIVGAMSGFLVTVVAIFLINTFRENQQPTKQNFV